MMFRFAIRSVLGECAGGQSPQYISTGSVLGKCAGVGCLSVRLADWLAGGAGWLAGWWGWLERLGVVGWLAGARCEGVCGIGSGVWLGEVRGSGGRVFFGKPCAPPLGK